MCRHRRSCRRSSDCRRCNRRYSHHCYRLTNGCRCCNCHPTNSMSPMSVTNCLNCMANCSMCDCDNGSECPCCSTNCCSTICWSNWLRRYLSGCDSYHLRSLSRGGLRLRLCPKDDRASRVLCPGDRCYQRRAKACERDRVQDRDSDHSMTTTNRRASASRIPNSDRTMSRTRDPTNSGANTTTRGSTRASSSSSRGCASRTRS